MSGQTKLKFIARFDTTRAKVLPSEDVHRRFGTMDIVTYPGPVDIEDANGDQIHFMGEVTFKINILNRVTTVSAWVTSEIPPGQLILGSGVLEDLNLTLEDIPDISSHSSRAVDRHNKGPAWEFTGDEGIEVPTYFPRHIPPGRPS